MALSYHARLAALTLSLVCASVARADEAAAQPEASQPAQGQETVQPATATPPEAAAEQPAPAKNKWEFATIGYVWFAGAWGETDVIGPVPPVDLDLPFGKVLKGFKFAFMGAAEARRDRFVLLGDVMFIHLGVDKGIGIRDPNFLEAELDSRSAAVTLVGGYRVVKDGPVNIDLLAGGRWNFLKTSLQLMGPNRSAEGSVKQSWLDPLIAARAQAPIGGKWSINAYGDLGGIIFGSDVTWQLIPTINYQISRKVTLGVGWRYWKVNYDHGNFLYNVHQSGPIIAFRTVL